MLMQFTPSSALVAAGGGYFWITDTALMSLSNTTHIIMSHIAHWHKRSGQISLEYVSDAWIANLKGLALHVPDKDIHVGQWLYNRMQTASINAN
jgi:hypothetical protein